MQLTTLLFSAFAALAVAAPAEPIAKRAEKYCGQWDSKTTGSYILYNNLWGKAAATSGSQCTTFTSNTANSIVWSTAWSWAGGKNNVKSYSNVVLVTAAKTISAIKSIPMTWSWKYRGTSIVANVSTDIFTSSTPTGAEQYEIMIWFGALGGAGPISSTGKAIATVTLEGATWKLWNGPNGNMNVFSFVATTEQANFKGDIKKFIDYLVTYQKLPKTQYIKSIGSGTEPFTGTNAVFATSAYKVAVN